MMEDFIMGIVVGTFLGFMICGGLWQADRRDQCGANQGVYLEGDCYKELERIKL